MESLSREQAQAVADAILTVADGGYERTGAVEKLSERFPGVDWWNLCFAGYADPRSLIPVEPLTREQAIARRKAVDAALVEYVEECREAMSQPCLL